AHLDRVFALADETGATIRLLVDDLEALRTIERTGRSPHIFIKIDCGYHRAGVDPNAPAAMALIEALDRSKAIIFDGILTHAGHGYHAQSKAELAAIAERERDVMLELAERARRSGAAVRAISIGSTPTMSAVEDLTGITEIRPGNYVFYDYMQVALTS